MMTAHERDFASLTPSVNGTVICIRQNAFVQVLSDERGRAADFYDADFIEPIFDQPTPESKINELHAPKQHKILAELFDQLDRRPGRHQQQRAGLRPQRSGVHIDPYKEPGKAIGRLLRRPYDPSAHFPWPTRSCSSGPSYSREHRPRAGFNRRARTQPDLDEGDDDAAADTDPDELSGNETNSDNGDLDTDPDGDFDGADENPPRDDHPATPGEQSGRDADSARFDSSADLDDDGRAIDETEPELNDKTADIADSHLPVAAPNPTATPSGNSTPAPPVRLVTWQEVLENMKRTAEISKQQHEAFMRSQADYNRRLQLQLRQLPSGNANISLPSGDANTAAEVTDLTNTGEHASTGTDDDIDDDGDANDASAADFDYSGDGASSGNGAWAADEHDFGDSACDDRDDAGYGDEAGTFSEPEYDDDCGDYD